MGADAPHSRQTDPPMTVTLSEAQRRLPELVEGAASGEDVVISRGDGGAVRLVPVADPATKPPQPPRRGGGARGLITVHDDFDDPLPDFEPYT